MIASVCMRCTGIWLLLSCQFVCVSRSLNNGLALTPPMGWLAWERFRCNIDCKEEPENCISERLYMDMADRLVADGYAAAGYNRVNIDDCWMDRKRDSTTGRLVPDPIRFPRGIKALADYVHSKGLKLGIYESFGATTCMGFPGSQFHMKIDAEAFAEWDADYLKFDGCFTETSLLPKGYISMGRYLNGTGRPMVYACSWPYYEHVVGVKPNLTRIAEHCNVWRVCDDIDDSYNSVMHIIDYYAKFEDMLRPVAGPGSWNDPDMLIIGNYGLSYDQAKAQFAMWAIFAAPLLMSNDLRSIAPEMRKILLNKNVIAVNQDKLGIQGRKLGQNHGIEVWSRPILPRGSLALVFLSRRIDGTPTKFVVTGRDVGLTSNRGYMLTDAFTQQEYGHHYSDDKIRVKVNPTGVVMLLAISQLEDHSGFFGQVAAGKSFHGKIDREQASTGGGDGRPGFWFLIIVSVILLICAVVFRYYVFRSVNVLCKMLDKVLQHLPAVRRNFHQIFQSLSNSSSRSSSIDL